MLFGEIYPAHRDHQTFLECSLSMQENLERAKTKLEGNLGFDIVPRIELQ